MLSSGVMCSKEKTDMTEFSQSSNNTKLNALKNGVTKPNIELEDFYSLLDPKVVEKIKQTSKEHRERIMNDAKQYECDIDGARRILDLLK